MSQKVACGAPGCVPEKCDGIVLDMELPAAYECKILEGLFGGHLRVSHLTHMFKCGQRLCRWDPINRILFVPTGDGDMQAMERTTFGGCFMLPQPRESYAAVVEALDGVIARRRG